MTISNERLSHLKQHTHEILERIKRLSFLLLTTRPLIQGSPGEVLRTCGKKNCKCTRGKANRHGPYRVVQVLRDGKSKQVMLRKDQKIIWDKARSYQQEMKYLLKLRRQYRELDELLKQLIKERIEQWP